MPGPPGRLSVGPLAAAKALLAKQRRAARGSAAGVLADAALSARARQPGSAAARARCQGPLSGGLRGLWSAAAPGGGDGAPELPAVHQPREPGRACAPGEPPEFHALLTPGGAGARGLRTALRGKGPRWQQARPVAP